MKERPILMGGPMVRALIAGNKTQTRRVINPQPDCDSTSLGHVGDGPCVVLAMREGMYSIPCDYGQPGDRLWVKETFYCDDYRYPEIPESERDDDWREKMVYYRADGDDLCNQIPECDCEGGKPPPWRPSIFMPRWASRITLEIVSVRVERLQDISDDDAIAEGIEVKPSAGIASIVAGGQPTAAQFEYYALWESINAKRHGGRYRWAKNPWVWRIEFKVLNHEPQTTSDAHSQGGGANTQRAFQTTAAGA